ncbi:MAG: hypothetical protein B7Z27_06950, partial [Sphingobacteriia bacterium 32-37-4]
LPVILNKTDKLTTVIIILYHTKLISFKLINTPNMPVKPAKKTEICNLMSACFTIEFKLL